MCHNQITHFNCNHIHTRVKLCRPALTPILHRATVFPYLQTLPPVNSLFKHDVMLQTVKVDAPCERCQQMDLRQGSGADNGVDEAQRDSMTVEVLEEKLMGSVTGKPLIVLIDNMSWF